MTKPLISIITPCLNRADFVDGAVRSVLDQGYANFEHLVMDAGSTDGTLELLRAYPHLRVTSEPDHGMYDAINKGIHASRGEIVGLLNTDDRYVPGAFLAVVEAFRAHPDSQAVVGGAEFLQLDGTKWSVVEHVPAIPAQDFWRRIILGNPISNAWFFRRQVFEQGGAYDDRFRWVADPVLPGRVGCGRAPACPGSGALPVPAAQRFGHPECRGLADCQIWPPAAQGAQRGGPGPRGVHAPGKDSRRSRARWMRRAHAELTYRLVATAAYHREWRLALGFPPRLEKPCLAGRFPSDGQSQGEAGDRRA